MGYYTTASVVLFYHFHIHAPITLIQEVTNHGTGPTRDTVPNSLENHDYKGKSNTESQHEGKAVKS